MLRLLLLFIILCAAGLAFAVYYLPWWGTAIGAIAFLVMARYLGGYLLKQLFLAAFRAKGAVLRGAKTDVHSIAPAAKPEDGSSNTEDDEFKDAPYYAIDVSIEPQNVKGPFRSFDPSEISLVEFGSVFNENDIDKAEGRVVKVEVFQNGNYHSFDENAPDSSRFRLTARIKPGKRKLAFRYYFETFGEVSVPAS